jgi:integrase
MEIDRQENGALIIRAYKGVPFYEAKWRDATKKQRKRRLGKAWLKQDSKGRWIKRPGRVPNGYLDQRRAYREMSRVIAEVEAEQQIGPRRREALFEDAVEVWLEQLTFEKRAKPSTLAGYRSLLAKPETGGKRRRGRRIMRAFAGRKLVSMTTQDMQRFLAKIDREPISPRTVNIHRQVLHSIFECARRADTFGLRDNPVAGTQKRPEEGERPIETFEPEELWAIADAARSGLHRKRSGYAHSVFSKETEQERQRTNHQDAAFFIVTGCTGLRMGEMLALRWGDIDLKAGLVTVSRAMSDGEEKSTKSRRLRPIPLADQAASELRALTDRPSFKSRTDFVFCRPDGGPLDRSVVRKRFIRAQKAAEIRVRRFHDLRHTFGSLAIQQFDVVAVKDMMGHSKLTTTERYLHSKPRPDDVAKLNRAFE